MSKITANQEDSKTALKVSNPKAKRTYGFAFTELEMRKERRQRNEEIDRTISGSWAFCLRMRA